MDSSKQKIFYYIGLVTVIVLAGIFLLPIVLKLVGAVLKVVIWIVFYGAIGLVVFLLINYIYQRVRK